VLSVFFGFGLVLLTFIQKIPDSAQAGLDKFLFGQAATLIERDVVVMASIGGVALLVTGLFWKEFKLLSFDPDFAKGQGFPVGFLDILLTTLLVVAIVIGLQTVGVVLMSALVVAPGASARQWTDNLGKMVVLSSFFGMLAGVSGSLLSSTVSKLPTGPIIVVCLTVIVVVSLLLAPNRGLVWRVVRERRNRSKIQVDAVLTDLYVLYRQHGEPGRAHSVEVLRTMSIGHGGTDRSLRELARMGLAREKTPGQWEITEGGITRAKTLAAGREAQA
jgi:manganese/zinc/iron transport system permease protein